MLLVLLAVYGAPMAERLRNNYLRKASLERAKAFTAQKNWHQAGQEFFIALQFLPNDPKILRELVNVLDTSKSYGPLMRNALLSLRELKSEKESDAILLARILLMEGQIEAAREAYNALGDTQRETPVAMTLQQDISVAEGNQASLEGLMHPEVKEAIALCRNPFAELQEKGIQTLWALTQTRDERGLQAMHFLASTARLTETQADLLIQRLEAHPKKNLPVLLSVYSGFMRNHPAEREKTLKNLVLKHRNTPLNELRIFLEWLALEGESKFLRSMISEETLYGDPAVFTAYIESFVTRARWTEVLNLLGKPEPHYPINPESLAFFRAQAWNRLEPDGEKAKEQFYLAIESSLAAQNTALLQRIAKETAELSLWDVCELAYSTLAELKPTLALSTLEKGLEAATHQRDSRRILRIVTQLTQLQGSNSTYIFQRCYLHLLQGSDIETLTLPSAQQAEPSALAFLQALRAYRFLDQPSMKHHLARVSDLNALNDGQKAVYVSLLRTVGSEQKSEEISKSIIPALLLPEEQAFLQKPF